jgi:hypothetical protein
MGEFGLERGRVELRSDIDSQSPLTGPRQPAGAPGETKDLQGIRRLANLGDRQLGDAGLRPRPDPTRGTATTSPASHHQLPSELTGIRCRRTMVSHQRQRFLGDDVLVPEAAEGERQQDHRVRRRYDGSLDHGVP